MTISFNSNRKMKIRINKEVKEQTGTQSSEVKNEQVQSFKSLYKAYRKNSKKSKKSSVTENPWQNFFEKISSTYSILSISVYTAVFDTYYKFSKVYGNTVTSQIILEKYFSLGATSVITNATGFADEQGAKSRYITSIVSNDKKYLIIISSRAFETFTNKFAAETITLSVKNIVGKLSEME